MSRQPSFRGLSFFGWLLLAAAIPVSGARLPFRVYRNADGLPQSQVMALVQDRRGEIWVGTWCGAARYDGARFRYLGERQGLPSNYVYDIVEDHSGDLWLAAGHGVVRMAAADLSKPAEVVELLVPPPKDSSVRDLYVDRAGVLWAATKGGEVARRAGKSFEFISCPEIDTDALEVIAESESGELVVGTDNGLYRIDGKTSRKWNASDGPWNQAIRMVYRASDGPLWFATESAVWRWSGGEAVELRDSAGASIGLARAALTDRRGRLWIATEKGLYRSGLDGVFRFGLSEGVSNDRIYRILEDREGDLWFGTDNGLTKYPGDMFRTFLPEDGLPSTSVWSVAVDSNGRLIAGTKDGAARFNGVRFEPLPSPNPLHDKTVRCIVDDGAGSIWFGTRNDGLFRWDGRTWRQFRPPDFPDFRVYGSFRDRRGDLWFGTRVGLARWHGNGFDLWRRSDGLPDDTVWMIREDPNGRIVVSTDRGLARLEGNRFVVPPELARFSEYEVRSFAYQPSGVLWVGTNGQGLFCNPGGSWKNYGAGAGPSDDFVWGLIADSSGRIWVATNHGIDLFDGKTWINFSERDGLLSDEIAVNAAITTPDGGVWFGFGGSPGIARFDPVPFTVPPMPPIVRVNLVTTSSRKDYAEPAKLRLPWNDHDLTFSFIGVSFRDEQKVVYQTKLEGYDRDWSPPGGDRTARYTNLEPKTYRFLVRAAGAGGVWSEPPAQVEIVIAPPVWQSLWFRSLSVLAGILLLALIIRLRVASVTREKELLEETVRDRTRSLEEKMALIAELKEKYEKLSTTDPLTGLANRRFFLEQFEKEISRAKRHGETIGLVLIDLDYFKTVNDRFGHQAGDAVLVAFARILDEWTRKTDLVARYGGEEFMVAFLHTDREGSLSRAEELRRHVEEVVFSADSHQVRITLSGGFTWQDFSGAEKDVSFDDLARSADRALYRAKESGRNRIEISDAD